MPPPKPDPPGFGIGALGRMDLPLEVHAAAEAGPARLRDRSAWADGLPQKSMPPMPPPPGIAGAASFFGISATIASVVMSSEATEAAS